MARMAEDERIAAEDLQKTLRNPGYSVLMSCGKEAPGQMGEDGPGLVLMNNVSRENTDSEAVEVIRGQVKIPVFYLTPCADENLFERAEVTELYKYFVNPFFTKNCIILKALPDKRKEHDDWWF